MEKMGRGTVTIIAFVCLFALLAYGNCRLGDKIFEETRTVTIADIVILNPLDEYDAKYQIKFDDGSWITIRRDDIVKTLKIGHNYRLTIGKTHFSENRGYWVIFEAEEIKEGP